MATTAPMRDGPPAGSSTGGDPRVTTTTSAVSSTSSSAAAAAAAATTTTSNTTNFDCDEEWTPIGINNLIIDLDADIEKTNEKSNVGNLTSGNGGCNSSNGSNVGGGGGGGGNSNGSNNVGISGGNSANMAAASSTNSSGGSNAGGKTSKSGSNSGGGSSGGGSSGGGGSGSQSSNIEHSSTVDKGLKLKIKRTKSGSKSSEKHEIVKTSEQQQQNGGDVSANCNSNDKGSSSESSSSSSGLTSKHSSSGGSGNSGSSVNAVTGSTAANSGSGAQNSASVSSSSGGTTSMNSSSNKRGGSSHKRDKTKEKHSTSGGDKSSGKSISGGSAATANQSSSAAASASSSFSLLSTSSSSANSTAGSAVPNSSVSSNSNASMSGTTDLNGIVRTPVQRVMYPMQTNGPGPPNASGPPPSPSKDALLGKPSAQSSYVGGGTSGAIISNTGGGGAQQTSSVLVTATSVASNPIASGSINQSSATMASGGGGLAATTFAATTSNTCALENGSVGLTEAGNATAGANMFTSAADDGTTRPQSPGSPPCKKLKTANCLINERRETKDACVGTSISTMTEPDCLGPCEPGTSVTLEGIVWHETEGVLVVNVTWRGKTYVGTLLDCTRYDWAPPRFCDSPTSDLDARLPKGRAKRGRTATNDLSNFTETRSSVHSKLRSSSNGSNKNARKGLSSSPTPFATPRPDPGSGSGAYANSNKRKSRPSEDESSSTASAQANGSKKSKSLSSSSSSTTAPASPPSSPVFYECPETNCCKKYRNLNGLKYHQSHAHGGACAGVVVDDDEATKESASMSETEELPSPVDQQSIKSERKDENFESEPATPVLETPAGMLTGGGGHPTSPHQLPSATATTTSVADMAEPVAVVEPLAPPIVDNKTVMKPHAIRYGVTPAAASDEISATALATSATTATPSMTTAAAKPPTLGSSMAGMRPVNVVPAGAAGIPLSLSTSSIVSQSTSTTSPSPPSMTQQIQLSPSQPTLPHPFVRAVSPLQASAPGKPSLPLNVSPSASAKLPQFKVKPASALLQDDKAKEKAKLQAQRKKNRKSPAGSPHSHAAGGGGGGGAGSDTTPFRLSTETSGGGGGREETRSPSAYSDISDDGAPVLEAEGNADAKKALAMDKKTMEGVGGTQSPHALQHYNMYSSFYQQPPYLVPSVQLDTTKGKDEKGPDGKLTANEKDKKEGDMSQKLIPPSHYYYPDYMPGYGYNLGSNYPISMVSSTSTTSNEKEAKDEGSKSPGPTDLVKQPAGLHPSSQALNAYPSPISSKSKLDGASKMSGGGGGGDPYPSPKDRVEARSPLSAAASTTSYLHAREHQMQQMQQQQAQQQQAQQQQQQRLQQMQLQSHPPPSGMHHTTPQQQMQQPPHHLQQSHQSHEDMRRYYGNMFPEQQRRKEQHASHAETPLKATPPPTIVNSKSNLSISSGGGGGGGGGGKHKDKSLAAGDESKKEDKVKQEGVKPTMETQGPPPSPASSYAYFPSPYLQTPYHGGIAFEQAHPMYRGMSSMMMPAGPYSNSPYLHHPAQMHAPMSRYHGPEDLSRPPSGSTTKALDMLHQASQYYPSSHKIHELQERAIKSPTPKTSAANASPSSAANGQPAALVAGAQLTPTSSAERLAAGNASQPSKASIDGKDSRSPPPQRHVHTHHHTHVGLGYPLLPGQYPAAYPAAAVLASEQAAGVASAASNPYSPK